MLEERRLLKKNSNYLTFPEYSHNMFGGWGDGGDLPLRKMSINLFYLRRIRRIVVNQKNYRYVARLSQLSGHI